MRKSRIIAALAALPIAAALALGSAGTAFAASDNNPQADIQQGNGFCGFNDTALPVIGFANYHRVGDTITVNYHIKDGRPDTVYHFSLWANPGCFPVGTLPDVTTNDNGVANANGDITLTGKNTALTTFFATSWDLHPAFEWNDTPNVTLTP
jgi:hypothetical protein